MEARDEVELRFERRAGRCIAVRAQYGPQCASRTFLPDARERDLFLWLGSQFSLGTEDTDREHAGPVKR